MRRWLCMLIALVLGAQSAQAEISAVRVRREMRQQRAAPADTSARMPVTDSRPAEPLREDTAHSYVCPMHMDYRSDAPGICSVCGMALVTHDDDPAAADQDAPPTTGTVRLTREQAGLLTMTFAEARARQIEIWVRGAASKSGEKQIRGRIYGPHAGILRDGQLVRATPMGSRVRPILGRLTVASRSDTSAAILVRLAADFPGAVDYALEIIAPLGERLAVPSEAVLITPAGPVVYRLASESGEELWVEPVPVRIGARGELFYEIIDGLEPGDKVAAVGLFYLDAAARLAP